MKKFFIFALFIFSFFFFKPVLAVDLFNSLIDQSQTLDNANLNWGYNNTGSKQYICQSFIPKKGNIDSVVVKLARVSGNAYRSCNGGFNLWLFKNTNGCNRYTAGLPQTLASVHLSEQECQNAISTTTASYVSFNFSSPVTLTASTTWFSLERVSSFTGDDFTVWYQNTDIYSDGVFGWYDGNPKYDANKDLYFIETYYNGLTTTSTSEAVIVSPVSGSTFTPEQISNSDVVAYSSYPDTTSVVYFQFRLFDQSSSTFPIYSGQLQKSNSNRFGYPAFLGNLGYVFTDGSYSLQVRAAYVDLNYITDWSPAVNFSVSSQISPLNEICELTDLVCMVQKGLSWAFIPDSAFINNFASSTQALLMTKKPFGYLFEISDIFSNLSASSTAIDLNLTFSVANQNINMPFINTEEPVLQDFLSSIRPFFIAALWCLFALYIFERLTDLNL